MVVEYSSIMGLIMGWTADNTFVSRSVFKVCSSGNPRRDSVDRSGWCWGAADTDIQGRAWQSVAGHAWRNPPPGTREGTRWRTPDTSWGLGLWVWLGAWQEACQIGEGQERLGIGWWLLLPRGTPGHQQTERPPWNRKTSLCGYQMHAVLVLYPHNNYSWNFAIWYSKSNIQKCADYLHIEPYTIAMSI